MTHPLRPSVRATYDSRAWRDDWMTATKETLMPVEPAGRAIEEAQQRVSVNMARLMTAEVVAEAVENATGQRRSSVLIAGKLLDALERAGYDVTPRASQAAIGLDQLAKLAEQAIADHSVCVNEGCPDERIIPPSLRWFVEDYLPAALTGGSTTPRASQAATGPHSPGDDAGAEHEAARGSAANSGARMDPDDVPGDLVVAAHNAWDKKPVQYWGVEDGVDGLDDVLRHILAAVIPAIRAAVFDQARAELMTTRDGITWDDDIADSARAAYSDAINRLDAIARGDQS